MYLPLCGSRILFLDNAADAAVGVVQDAAVACRIPGLGRQHTDESLRSDMTQWLERVSRDQRHIAVHDQHGIAVRNRRHDLRHGMTGTQLPVLHDPVHTGIREDLPDMVRTMADHDMQRRMVE